MSKVQLYRENTFQESPIGKISQEWEVNELESVTEVYDSKRIPLSKMERKNKRGPFPYCGANGVIDYIDDYIFDGEYVLLAEDGGAYGKFENTAYLMRGKFWVNNHAHILKAIEGKASNQFLKTALDFLDLNSYVVGSTRKKLNQERMRQIKIPIPSLLEQRDIVGVLSVVDSVIEYADKIIAKSERLKQGLIQRLLTHGIGHTEYKQTPIGNMPKDWEVKPLDEVCAVIVDCPHTTPKFTPKGALIIRNFNIRSGELVFDPAYFTSEEEWQKRTQRLIPQNDDVLFSREAPVGEAALAPKNIKFSLGQRMMLLRTDKKVLNPLFLVYSFYSPLIQRKLKNLEAGVTAHHVNVADIRKLEVPIPPLTEQEKIANIIWVASDKLKLEQKEEERLVNIKQGLMDLLLTGRVRVKVS